ncbi:class I lanthipeptide [Pontimicrobium sp. MEBiC06410]
MKTQAKNKLQFNKQNIIELNDANMANIKGGTDTISTIQCTLNSSIVESIMPPRGTSWLCSIMIQDELGFGQ